MGYNIQSVTHGLSKHVLYAVHRDMKSIDFEVVEPRNKEYRTPEEGITLLKNKKNKDTFEIELFNKILDQELVV